MVPELQEQPVPMNEISKMEIITITNPNSINNFLIIYALYYFICGAKMATYRSNGQSLPETVLCFLY